MAKKKFVYEVENLFLADLPLQEYLLTLQRNFDHQLVARLG